MSKILPFLCKFFSSKSFSNFEHVLYFQGVVLPLEKKIYLFPSGQILRWFVRILNQYAGLTCFMASEFKMFCQTPIKTLRCQIGGQASN